jgi:hypothetical protein
MKGIPKAYPTYPHQLLPTGIVKFATSCSRHEVDLLRECEAEGEIKGRKSEDNLVI